MSDVEELEITKAQSYMLDMIRGLNQDVMYMVILAEQTPDGGCILKGTPETFTKLRHDLYDELELKPKSRIVRSLLNKLSPEDW